MRSGNRWLVVAGIVLGLVTAGGCSGPYMMEMAAGDSARIASSRGEAIHAKPEKLTSPKADPARSKRLVIYNGSIHLVVQHVSDALDQVKKLAEGMGGWMQQMSATSITVKVPADKFLAAVDQVEQLGEVASKEVKGTDVTDQVRDLRIRLENAETLRKRLLALLEKSTKVEDTLKIERELARTTETIEMIKGKLRYIEDQVAYSTLTVHVNSPLPQQQVTTEIPFQWVRSLGEDLTRGRAGRPGDYRGLWGGVRLGVPASYIKYYRTGDETRAMSADGVLLRVRRQDNYKGGDLVFWSELVRAALVKQRAVAVGKPEPLDLATGVKARMISGTKRIGKETYGYMVVVAVRKHHVYTFEAWGKQEGFDRDKGRLKEAAVSLRIGSLYQRIF